LLTYWTSAVDAHGNEVNNFYLGLYAMLSFLGLLGIVLGILQLVLIMMPKRAEVLHERLVTTVMSAPLSFFTKTDVGTTTNRLVVYRLGSKAYTYASSSRFSQDMTIVDTELPYSLVDLCFSIVTTIMGAILMCLSAGYFAATMPPVILAVWGRTVFHNGGYG
jgi:ATP-binding cassette subfamily C (CFTR/MRP) protein 1